MDDTIWMKPKQNGHIPGKAVVNPTDLAVSTEEFGRMLTTYAGWGMRIKFVPDDHLHRWPAHEVREPKAEDE